MSILRRIERDEGGFIVIVAVVLLSVMATLSTLVLTSGSQADRSSGRGRSWAQALHVAEAGLEAAIARLDAAGGSWNGSFSGSITEGTYCVEVEALPRWKRRIVATGVAPVDPAGECTVAGAGVGAARTLEVILAPPPVFRYALFSFTSMDTKNNNRVDGDIWANQNVTIDQDSVIEGSVTAATGWVRLRERARVTGNVWTGGFDPDNARAVWARNNAVIEGNVKASSALPPADSNCHAGVDGNWRVRLDGTNTGFQVLGDVISCGPVTGPGTVGGEEIKGEHTAAPATLPMPPFTYDPAHYDATTLREFGTPGEPSATAVAEAQAYIDANAGSLSGTIYVNQSPPVNQDVRVELQSVTISGDFNLISNTPIFAHNTTSAASVGDAIFVLVSTYQPPEGTNCDVNQNKSECSIHINNNFEINPDGECDVAVLVFAPYGPVSVKNNQDQCGTIYARNMQIKNNQTMIYDERVERLVGFGEVILEVASWVELAPDA